MTREKSILWTGAILAFGALVLSITFRSASLASPFASSILLIVFGAGVAVTTYALSRLRVLELEHAQSSSDKNLVKSERALQDSERHLAAQSAALTELMERQAGSDILEDRVPEILVACAQTIAVR